MARVRLYLALAVVLGAAGAQAQNPSPHLGYAYPAGGRQGTAFRVTLGGQFLQRVEAAYVSGDGVSVKVVEHVRALNNKDLGIAGKYIRWLIRERNQAAFGKKPATPATPPAGAPPAAGAAGAPAADPKKPAILNPDEELPNHPWLRDLDKKGIKQLEDTLERLTDPKKQPNPQIGEMVLLDVNIAVGAAPGDRELRLFTPLGLTNPLRFQVGTLPEMNEPDPLAEPVNLAVPPELPLVINGQILPGDVDHFRFRAHAGQQLVVEAQARRLIPYLADAVPGWFQAALTLYDGKGIELEHADHYGFDPDPVLLCKIPSDGDYSLEIRDSIYRGRDDFVYRIAMGELPFITGIYPLGAQQGSQARVTLFGWNLPERQLALDTKPGELVRDVRVGHEGLPGESARYAVGTLPEVDEQEPNDRPREAQAVTLPVVINGRVNQPGDVDQYQFQGRGGQDVVIDVVARRLRSPVDSLVRLIDSTGKILAYNDDHEDPAIGMMTHHADSYLRLKLPADGTYRVELTDIQRQGGDDFGYRLRISAPQPDFALRVTPSSMSLPAGRVGPVWVHAVRQDGFDGEINLSLSGAPSGFVLGGGRIPPGHDKVRITITSPWLPLDKPADLKMEGRATVGGVTLARPVVPADDMMQAFAYRHLVAARELMVTVPAQNRANFTPAITSPTPARIPAGGTATVEFKIPRAPRADMLKYDLLEPPKGVTLQAANPTPDGVSLVLRADGKDAPVGFADNVVVQVSLDIEVDQGGGKGKVRRRFPANVLPAIPIEVVAPGAAAPAKPAAKK